MASVATSQAEEVAAPSPAPAPAPAADAAAVDDGSTADSDRGGGAWRRWAPGSKAAAYASWKDVELKDMKEPFAVQQYIQQLIRASPSDVVTICTCPSETESSVWTYEHLRIFALELNFMAVALRPACTKVTCPVMVATDDCQYLCAAHKRPKECCAIDYMVHTLDGTACLLNNSKIFPSRVLIPPKSIPYFQSIARRLYRIFAHAYYYHRAEYQQFENERHLCDRFTCFVKMFRLMPSDQLVVPH